MFNICFLYCSLYFYDSKDDLERGKMALLYNYFDTIALPTYPYKRAVANAWFTVDLAHPISAMVDQTSLDHVVYKIIDSNQKSLFAFLTVISFECWIVLFMSLLSYILLSYCLAFKSNLRKHIWFYSASFIHDVPYFQKHKDRILALIWSLMISVVFVNYYSGELVTSLTTTAPPIVIDSWDDLAKQDPNIPIIVVSISLDFEDYEDQPTTQLQKDLLKSYINPKNRYYDTLSKRLKMVSIGTLASVETRGRLYNNISKGDFIVLTSTGRSLVDYDIFHLNGGEYRDKLHVSKNGGDVQPLFFTFMNTASAYDVLVNSV